MYLSWIFQVTLAWPSLVPTIQAWLLGTFLFRLATFFIRELHWTLLPLLPLLQFHPFGTLLPWPSWTLPCYFVETLDDLSPLFSTLAFVSLAQGWWLSLIARLLCQLLQQGPPFGNQDVRFWHLWSGPDRLTHYYQHLVPADAGWRIQLKAKVRLKRQARALQKQQCYAFQAQCRSRSEQHTQDRKLSKQHKNHRRFVSVAPSKRPRWKNHKKKHLYVEYQTPSRLVYRVYRSWDEYFDDFCSPVPSRGPKERFDHPTRRNTCKPC